jgi:hypothetical protein
VFQGNCSATNSTPAYDLSLVGAEPQRTRRAYGMESDARLPPGGRTSQRRHMSPDMPIDLMLIVQLTGAKLEEGKGGSASHPPRPLGIRYRSHPITFKPARTQLLRGPQVSPVQKRSPVPSGSGYHPALGASPSTESCSGSLIRALDAGDGTGAAGWTMCKNSSADGCEQGCEGHQADRNAACGSS